ncbi:MAG: hypothetical protein ABI144_02900 [Gallionella sp.]
MTYLNRRNFVKALSTLPLVFYFPKFALAQNLPNISELKVGYAQRLKLILNKGNLPYIDIESSCKSSKIDIDWLAKSMDELNIGLMALSADVKEPIYDDLSGTLNSSYPNHFIPVGNGGMTISPDEFLDAQDKVAQEHEILLFGEYEFRHYPSPRQVKRGKTDRDVFVPINGPVGHHAFSLSEKTGMAFQIHYEIEDELLLPLESMLAQYPKSKVIWCHLAQIRYIERASRYTPTYVDSLIARFPNLYFDTAFGNASSTYPLSGQHHARVWAEGGGLKSEWRDLIVAHSDRIFSALDLGQDRMNKIGEKDHNHRMFLSQLPADTQHKIAYRNTWKLLFKEDFS